MNAKRFAQPFALGLLSIAVICLTSGCGEPAASEYQSYAELDDARDDVEAEEQSPPSTQQEAVDRKSDQAADAVAVAEKPQNTATGINSDAVAAKSPAEVRNTSAADPQPGNDPVPGSTVSQTTVDPKQPGETDSPQPRPNDGTPQPGAQQNSADKKPRKVEVLVKNREFKVEGPEDAWRVTYDDIDLLRVLNMDPVTPDAPELMPQWLKDLDGKRIRIRGFMFPSFMESGITLFALARDNQICCFGRNPKIYDLFEVRMRSGETTNYIQNRPFDVVGVFHIRPEAEDGKLYRLYLIDDAIVFDKR